MSNVLHIGKRPQESKVIGIYYGKCFQPCTFNCRFTVEKSESFLEAFKEVADQYDTFVLAGLEMALDEMSCDIIDYIRKYIPDAKIGLNTSAPGAIGPGNGITKRVDFLSVSVRPDNKVRATNFIMQNTNRCDVLYNLADGDLGFILESFEGLPGWAKGRVYLGALIGDRVKPMDQGDINMLDLQLQGVNFAMSPQSAQYTGISFNDTTHEKQHDFMLPNGKIYKDDCIVKYIQGSPA